MSEGVTKQIDFQSCYYHQDALNSRYPVSSAQQCKQSHKKLNRKSQDKVKLSEPGERKSIIAFIVFCRGNE